MPDEWDETRKVERWYYWAVAYTMVPKYIDEFIEDIKLKRRQRREEVVNELNSSDEDMDFDEAENLLRYQFKSSKYTIIIITSIATSHYSDYSRYSLYNLI